MEFGILMHIPLKVQYSQKLDSVPAVYRYTVYYDTVYWYIGMFLCT